MAARRWSGREQLLAFGAGGVILVWLIVSWIAGPLVGKVQQVRETSALAQEKYARLAELAGQGADIEGRYAGYAAFRSGESAESLQRKLLGDLETLASQTGVQLNLKPRPMHQDDRSLRLSVEVDADGSQDALLQFLDQLFSAPGLLQIDRVRLTASLAGDRPLRANLLLTQLVFRESS